MMGDELLNAMKIHPNNDIKRMLKNGDAKIVDYKFLHQRYNAIQNTDLFVYPVENSHKKFREDDETSLSAIEEELPVALPDIFLTEPSNAISSQIPYPQTPPTAEQSYQNEIPTACVVLDETPDALSTNDQVVPNDMPTSPAKPNVLPDAEIPVAVPSVISRIIQLESSPGGLIAEIHFEGDPSGQVFGTQPGYVSFSAELGLTSSEDNVLMEDSYPPYVNFITFNRLGLTIKNLSNLLDSEENFELNIIDCNSKDNSWDYIQSLNDPRIKSRIRFDKNCGPIFAVNFGLSRRKPSQYFFAIDSDTYIKTKNWIARFMEVFEAFPEVGLLGLTRDNPYPRYLPPVIPRTNGTVSYLQLKDADINAPMDFIPGQLQCLRPGLIKEIGYWSEENGFGDAEISPRITHYTDYTVGFITTIEIDMTQRISCDECLGGASFCTLNRSTCDCFMLSKLYNKNELFVEKNTWKFKQCFQELLNEERTAYCASIHDPESVKNHKYNADWAYDNFNHYIINAN